MYTFRLACFSDTIYYSAIIIYHCALSVLWNTDKK